MAQTCGTRLQVFNANGTRSSFSMDDLKGALQDEGQLGFLDLDDTPLSYTGQADRVVAVRPTEDGLDFIDVGDIGGGVESGTWSEVSRVEDTVDIDGVIIDRIQEITFQTPGGANVTLQLDNT